MANEIKIKMTKKKETKGTYVFEAPDSVIPSVYIRKNAWASNPPTEIEITIVETK